MIGFLARLADPANLGKFGKRFSGSATITYFGVFLLRLELKMSISQLRIPVFVVPRVAVSTAARLASAIHTTAFAYVKKPTRRGKRLLAADALLCAIIIDVRASSCSGGLHLLMQLTLGLALRLFDDLPFLPSLARPGGCPGDHCRTVLSIKPTISGSSTVPTFSAKAVSLKRLIEFVRIRKSPAARRAAFRLAESPLFGLFP
jgi:hypothetical protein